jgi:multidrug efflux pump subunit AcrB
VEKVQFGQEKFQAELLRNFVFAVIAGVILVFATLVLLYKRVLPPFVNMGSLLLAPLGGALALHLTGNPVSMPVFIGLLMLLASSPRTRSCWSIWPSRKWARACPRTRRSWRRGTSACSRS